VEWRGINIPITTMKVAVRHDLVQHKYWGVDAANVESTGRSPMEIEATIPFVNGIVPGKGEKWGVLYPTTFRDFLKAFADGTSGILVHPELGDILCKPESLSFDHEAQRRDGVVVTAKWIETVELDKENPLSLFGSSPIQNAELAALDLDASKEDLLKLVPDAEFNEETFEDFVDKLTDVADTVSSTVTLFANKPKQLLYRVQRLQNSIERAGNVLTWTATESLEKLKEAAIAMHDAVVDASKGNFNSLNPLPRKMKRYITPATMGIANIAAATGATVDELIDLNPILVARPQVPARTVIRHY
jgi:prophage DNA circulation protein